jgi:hypothetical protein
LAEGSPVLVRLIAQIASRFGIVVTQKLAAQVVPFIGAVGGAAVNYAFIDHFQEVARAHFIVRRLERRYGKGTVLVLDHRWAVATTKDRKTAQRIPAAGPCLNGSARLTYLRLLNFRDSYYTWS